MDMPKKKGNVEVLRLTKSKVWQGWSYAKAQVVDFIFTFNLEYRYAILFRGMQHWFLKRQYSTVLIGYPGENPWEKPMFTNFEKPGRPSPSLVDQVRPTVWVGGFSSPDRSEIISGICVLLLLHEITSYLHCFGLNFLLDLQHNHQRYFVRYY